MINFDSLPRNLASSAKVALYQLMPLDGEKCPFYCSGEVRVGTVNILPLLSQESLSVGVRLYHRRSRTAVAGVPSVPLSDF